MRRFSNATAQLMPLMFAVVAIAAVGCSSIGKAADGLPSQWEPSGAGQLSDEEIDREML